LRGTLTVLGIKPTDKLVSKIAFQEAIFDPEARYDLIRSEMSDEQFAVGRVPFDPRIPNELFAPVERSLKTAKILYTQELVERLVFLRLLIGPNIRPENAPEEVQIAIDAAMEIARPRTPVTPSLGR
jgi:hypothetical protein